jgi:hypothetical protein
MSFSYTQIDNPTGTGPFTFNPSYSDASELVVMGYTGKHWSPLSVASVDAQTVTLSAATDALQAIRISNNASKVNAAITNGSDGNMLDEDSHLHDALQIHLEDPTDRTGNSPMTPEGITIGGLKNHIGREAKGGYEFTGGFSDRLSGQAGANDLGEYVQYTQAMSDAGQWMRFGFSSAAQSANDSPYWTDPTPSSASGVGLFGGSYMPAGVSSMFDFSFDVASYSDAVSSGDLQYTAATGSYDFSECKAGDLALVRFDFNVIPQFANTTLEVALIWQTRAADGTPTYTFPLTTQPIFFGEGTVGSTYLNRPIISAYFASNEDVNAVALPAIRANNQIQVAPLTTLVTIQR